MKRNNTTTIIISSILVLLVVLSVVFSMSIKGSVSTSEKDDNVSSESALISEEEEPTSEELSSEEREKVTLEYPYFIEIDKGAQIVTIFTTNEEGKYEKIVREIPISSGVVNGKLPDGYYKSKDTKHRWQTMFSLGDPIYCQYTTRITGNFLFHSLPYRRNGDPASLNASAYNKLGTPASGGCIRMTVENAKWIYDNIEPGTTIHVVTGEPRPADLKRILPSKIDSSAKWDPSDPDPDNPDYKTMYPNPDPEPDPYAELYPYKFEYNKDIPVTPQKTTTTTGKTKVNTTVESQSETTSNASTAETPAPTQAPTQAPATDPET